MTSLNFNVAYCVVRFIGALDDAGEPSILVSSLGLQSVAFLMLPAMPLLHPLLLLLLVLLLLLLLLLLLILLMLLRLLLVVLLIRFKFVFDVDVNGAKSA